jgi:hypothetical protein
MNIGKYLYEIDSILARLLHLYRDFNENIIVYTKHDSSLLIFVCSMEI